MSDGTLFDASSVVELLVGEAGSGVPTERLYGGHLLDMTLYETTSVLWKLSVAYDELADDDYHDALGVVSSLHTEMCVETAIEDGFDTVAETARNEGLNPYDAAYLVVAQRDDLTLVTEDKPLRETADGYVSVATVVGLGEPSDDRENPGDE